MIRDTFLQGSRAIVRHLHCHMKVVQSQLTTIKRHELRERMPLRNWRKEIMRLSR